MTAATHPSQRLGWLSLCLSFLVAGTLLQARLGWQASPPRAESPARAQARGVDVTAPMSSPRRRGVRRIRCVVV